jgi:hypothetical protein
LNVPYHPRLRSKCFASATWVMYCTRHRREESKHNRIADATPPRAQSLHVSTGQAHTEPPSEHLELDDVQCGELGQGRRGRGRSEYEGDVHLMQSHVSGVSHCCGVWRAPEQKRETEKRAEARSRCIIVSRLHLRSKRARALAWR